MKWMRTKLLKNPQPLTLAGASRLTTSSRVLSPIMRLGPPIIMEAEESSIFLTTICFSLGSGNTGTRKRK